MKQLLLFLFIVLISLGCSENLLTVELLCVDNYEFGVLHSGDPEDRVEQSEAEQLCTANGFDSLASIFNQRQHDRVLGLINTLLADFPGQFSPDGFWIGLLDSSIQNGVPDDPLRFDFTEDADNLNKSFFDRANRFPWGNDQPGRANQRCVVMTTDGSVRNNDEGLWEDKACSENFDTLCRRTCVVGDDIIPPDTGDEIDENGGLNIRDKKFFYFLAAGLATLSFGFGLCFFKASAKRRSLEKQLRSVREQLLFVQGTRLKLIEI